MREVTIIVETTPKIVNVTVQKVDAGLQGPQGIQGIQGLQGTIELNEIYTMQALGSNLAAKTFSILEANTALTLSDNQVRLNAIYLPAAKMLNGVRWYQRMAGVYTEDNTNGVALYSYFNGVLTLVASSLNTGNAWKATANTFGNLAFSSSYVAQAGLYYVALLYNQSAQTTAPQIAAHSTLNNANMVSGLFTNAAKMFGVINGNRFFPATINMSAITASIVPTWLGIY